MQIVADSIVNEEAIEKHCRNLLDFKGEKLSNMGDLNKKRPRRSISELYASDVNEITELVLKTIKNYKEVDQLSERVAQERALADYMFWYNNDLDKQRELEKRIYLRKK